MSEERQASLLARWLDQPELGPPADLEADVAEALFALRPDLAPPPRVSVEDILDAVAEGPLAEAERREAAALAGWLDADDDDEGDDIDADTAAAVYALRPDLAPAPRVGLDDILGAVRAGPFAASAAPPVEAAPAAAPAAAPPAAEVVDLAKVREARRSWWAVPGLAALAAAAAALLVVQPLQEEGLPASAPESRSPLDPTLDAARQEAAPEAPAAAATPAPAKPSLLPEPDAAARAPSAGLEGGWQAPSGEIGDLATQPGSAGPRPADSAMGGNAGVGSGWADDDNDRGMLAEEAPTVESAKQDMARERSALAYDAPATATPAPMAPPAAAGASAYGGDGDEAEGRSEEIAAAADSTRAKRPRSARSDNAPAVAAPAGTPAPAQPAASLDQLRASAWSNQAVPDVAARYPDAGAAYAQATSLAIAGDVSGALAVLRPWLAHADPDVRLETTWQQAQVLLRVGRVTTAIAAIDAGLATSGGDSLLRSRLLALKGQLLERSGEPESAADAYRQAVEAR